jgi:cell division protein FtsB
MSAKSYKAKFADPLVKKLKSLVKKVLARCFKALDDYWRLNVTNGQLYRENERLSKTNDRLKEENESLRTENKDYKLLRKVFGNKQIDDLLEKARASVQSKQREKRFRNNDFER